jgi:hypothetical protein
MIWPGAASGSLDESTQASDHAATKFARYIHANPLLPRTSKQRIAWPFASKAQTPPKAPTTMGSWDLGYSWPTGLALACRSATLLTLYDGNKIPGIPSEH